MFPKKNVIDWFLVERGDTFHTFNCLCGYVHMCHMCLIEASTYIYIYILDLCVYNTYIYTANHLSYFYFRCVTIPRLWVVMIYHISLRL